MSIWKRFCDYPPPSKRSRVHSTLCIFEEKSSPKCQWGPAAPVDRFGGMPRSKPKSSLWLSNSSVTWPLQQSHVRWCTFSNCRLIKLPLHVMAKSRNSQERSLRCAANTSTKMQLMKICYSLLSWKLTYSFWDVCFMHIVSFFFLKVIFGGRGHILNRNEWRVEGMETWASKGDEWAFFPLPSYGVEWARTVQIAKAILQVPLQDHSSIHGLWGRKHIV